jgi:hypothetical protein
MLIQIKRILFEIIQKNQNDVKQVSSNKTNAHIVIYPQ